MPSVCQPLPAESRHSLPSGRSVVLRIVGTNEELEVRSPSGETELRVVLTDQGPVLRLSGVRLELEAAETVSVRCRNFEVDASEEMRVRTQGDIHLNGDYIRLNCEG